VAHHQNPAARSGRNAPQERASLWQPFLRQTPSVDVACISLDLSADDKKNDKQSLCLIWLKCNVYCVYHTWHFHTCPYIPVHSHSIASYNHINTYTGWWFGTNFICSIIYGIILLIDFHILQDG
jgi:hypothetical protein